MLLEEEKTFYKTALKTATPLLGHPPLWSVPAWAPGALTRTAAAGVSKVTILGGLSPKEMGRKPTRDSVAFGAGVVCAG